MNLHVETRKLLPVLARAAAIAPRGGPSTALCHVLLTANDNGLRISATDTAMSYIGDVEANVEAPGEVAVNAQKLLNKIKAAPASSVHIELRRGDKLRVESGDALWGLRTTPAEDFPQIYLAPDDEAGGVLRVGAARLAWMIRRAFTVCDDDRRFGINGAHWERVPNEGGDHRLRQVVTDGHRLTYAEIPAVGPLSIPERMLIPRSALSEMRKVAEGLGDEEVQISFTDNAAELLAPGARFLFRLVDGEFPAYHMMLRAEHKRAIEVQREDLLGALRVVMSVEAQEQELALDIRPTELRLTITNKDQETGESHCPCELNGEPIRLGVNPRYLTELVQSTEGATLRIGFVDELHPIVIAEPPEGDVYLMTAVMRMGYR